MIKIFVSRKDTRRLVAGTLKVRIYREKRGADFFVVEMATTAQPPVAEVSPGSLVFARRHSAALVDSSAIVSLDGLHGIKGARTWSGTKSILLQSIARKIKYTRSELL
jgi:hypothetical protein